MTSRTPTRLQLGAAAVLSVAEAVALLPWGDSTARQWLKDQGLIIRRAGIPRPVVVWGHVLDALQRVDEPEQPKPAVSAWRRSTNL